MGVVSNWTRRGVTAAFCCAMLGATSAFSAVISWTNWTAATVGTPGTASGTITLPDSSTIGVSYTGEVSGGGRTNTTNTTPSWLPAATFSDGVKVNNGPPTGDRIGLLGGNQNLNTVTFSTPVTNPVMAIWSLGQGGAPASFVFSSGDTPTFVSGGPSQEFNGIAITVAGNTVNGREGNGVVQFDGTFSSLSWTNPNFENYYGFTLGVAGRGVVPEPGTYVMLLSGLGLLVFGMRSRISRK